MIADFRTMAVGPIPGGAIIDDILFSSPGVMDIRSSPA